MKIKNFKTAYIFSILSLGFLSVSCEKVVQLDLNEIEETYIIDGMVSNIQDYNYVKLSKLSGFYDNQVGEGVSGANVKVEDEDGNVFTLTETTQGLYTNPLLIGQAFKKYNLTIEVGNETITAETSIPGNVEIDTIEIQEVTSPFFAGDFVGFVYWIDDENAENYYRIRAFENSKKTSPLYISSDVLYNGIRTGTPLFTNELYLNDTLRIELMQIDKQNYNYWNSLAQNADVQNPPAAPGNPEGNIVGTNATGFFGGYNMAIDTVIIE